MRRLIALSALAVAVAHTSPAAAQVPYSVTHGTVPYQPFSGGTVHPPVAYSVFPAFDEGSAAIPIPFTFNWFGASYTTVHAYTNGFVSFSPPTTMGILAPPRTIPSPVNVIHDFIGVLWQDLTGGPNPAIRSRVTGAAGARVLEIQYEGFERNNAPSGTTGVAFQVRLYEGSNSVEIVYGPNFGIVGATAAIENALGTQGINLMGMSASCTGTCVCGPRQCSSLNFGGAGGRTIFIELPNQAEVQGSVLAPPGAFAGATFDATLNVLNAGLAAAGPFTYEVLLSTSNTSTAGAATLGTYTVPAGLGGVSGITPTVTLTVPPGTPVGDYYVALAVDTTYAVTEVDETNNVSFSGLFRTGPELTGSVSGPAETGPAEPFDVQLTLQSNGAPVAGPVQVQFYLSPTPTLTGSEIAIVPPQSVTLPDGFSTTQTLTLTTPVATPPSPPNYYIVAVIDPQNTIVETDETNNTIASSATLEVRGPDISVSSFDGGEFGFRGVAYPSTTVISNAGAATARDFTVCVFLSDNLLISVISDVRLAETGLITLAPGETRTLQLQPMIPTMTSTGTWYIAAVADCGTVVPESVETNNTRRRADPITVIDPSPDFTPLEVATASSAAAGETLPVSVTVGNVGNLTGPVSARFVISDNPGITAQDTVILAESAPIAVDAAQQVTISGWATLPGDLPTGNYYIGVIVDPTDAVVEVREDNNTGAAGPLVVVGTDLAIVSPIPPHPVIGNPYAWRFAAAGGSAAYVWTATWDGGTAPAGLAFDASNAELSGMPLAEGEGTYNLTLRVTSGNLSVEENYTLIVSQPTLPLTVVTSRLPPAVATEPYSVQLIAAGGVPPYEWALGSPGPAGVSVASDGELGGEPQLVGPSTFTVVVRDQIGQRASGRLSLDVVDPTASITITTPAIPSGVANEAYQTAFAATGGQQPYTWVLEGTVPPGIRFEAETAQLTGTPTVAGEYELLLEVRDAMGLLDRNAYVLEVFEEGVLRIVTGSSEDEQLPEGELDKPYLDEDGAPVALVASPPEGVRWVVANGTLPPGIALDMDSGVLGGTPSEAGAFAFTVIATNAANDVRRRSLVILITDPSAVVQPPDAGGCVCVTSTPGAGSLWLAGLLFVGLGWRRRRG